MSILQLILTLVVSGVILWVINTYIPMDEKIKKILNVVVIIIMILWLLSVFGVVDYMSNIHMGKIHLK
jgi:hypothetical protein